MNLGLCFDHHCWRMDRTIHILGDVVIIWTAHLHVSVEIFGPLCTSLFVSMLTNADRAVHFPMPDAAPSTPPPCKAPCNGHTEGWVPAKGIQM